MIKITSVEQFRSVYDPIDDLVFLFDHASLNLLAANSAFYKTFQLNPDDKNLRMSDILPAEGPLLELQEGKAVEISFSKTKDVQLPLQLLGYQAVFKNKKAIFGTGKNLSHIKETEDKLKFAETEKRALLNEIYHRVKNNLNIIVSLLSLQMNRVEDPAVRHLLMESKSRVFALSLLQQKLHESPRISEIKVKDYLQYLGKRIIYSFNSKAKNISLVTEIENCWLDVNSLVPLGLITNELLTNSVVHAFPSQQEGEIRILLKKCHSEHFILQIIDNGIGLSQGNNFSDYPQTLGLQLVQSLARQLRAEISVRSSRNEGVDISFRFKLTANGCI